MIATIKEDYCDFETAKLLKEKGFHEDCKCQYGKGGSIAWTSCNNGNVTTFARPTIQMTMKWLREVHHIFIQVELYSKHNDYCFELFQNTHRLMQEHETYNNYEQACETAIKYCLENLI